MEDSRNLGLNSVYSLYSTVVGLNCSLFILIEDSLVSNKEMCRVMFKVSGGGKSGEVGSDGRSTYASDSSLLSSEDNFHSIYTYMNPHTT